jgi:hypothetical protein
MRLLNCYRADSASKSVFRQIPLIPFSAKTLSVCRPSLPGFDPDGFRASVRAGFLKN